MKKVAILPKRLKDAAMKAFPDLDYPDFSVNDKVKNAQRIRSANQLVMFVDSEFYKAGKSIGTKVEYANNLNKVSNVYELQPDGTFFEIMPCLLVEPLPTWDDYVKGIESLPIPIVERDVLDPETCLNFVHNPNPTGEHIHVCSSEKNVTKRCGYNSAFDSKVCPLYAKPSLNGGTV